MDRLRRDERETLAYLGQLPASVTSFKPRWARVGLIAAEMYVSVRGIGRLIQVYSTSDRAAEIFVLVTVVALPSLFFAVAVTV